MGAVKNVAIVEQPTGVAVFERLAMDPNIDVDKLERLMELYQKGKAQSAKEMFFAAFSKMQSELPAIERKGRGHQSVTYAKNDDIQEAVRPVLERHGFSLSFRTEFPERRVRIVTVLAHAGGHEERTEFIADADTSGSKNAIQALGSTISYGKRYGTAALLNITTTDERDDDGASSGKPEPPKNYDDLMAAFEDSASQGYPASRKFFSGMPEAVRNYALKYAPARLAEIKAKAQQVAK